MSACYAIMMSKPLLTEFRESMAQTLLQHKEECHISQHKKRASYLSTQLMIHNEIKTSFFSSDRSTQLLFFKTLVHLGPIQKNLSRYWWLTRFAIDIRHFTCII